jgi:hypothetical protein
MTRSQYSKNYVFGFWSLGLKMGLKCSKGNKKPLKKGIAIRLA